MPTKKLKALAAAPICGLAFTQAPLQRSVFPAFLINFLERANQAATGTEVIAWAIQRHVDFTDRKTSLSYHGRQISESEPEAQGTAKGESQQRDSEERAAGFSRQVRAEKKVGDVAKQQPTLVRYEIPPGSVRATAATLQRCNDVTVQRFNDLTFPWPVFLFRPASTF